MLAHVATQALRHGVVWMLCVCVCCVCALCVYVLVFCVCCGLEALLERFVDGESDDTRNGVFEHGIYTLEPGTLDKDPGSFRYTMWLWLLDVCCTRLYFRQYVFVSLQWSIHR